MNAPEKFFLTLGLIVISVCVLVGALQFAGMLPSSGLPTLTDQEQTALHLKLLELDNLALRIQPLQQQYQTLNQETIQLIDQTFAKYKLSKDRYDLDLHTFRFVLRAAPIVPTAPSK